MKRKLLFTNIMFLFAGITALFGQYNNALPQQCNPVTNNPGTSEVLTFLGCNGNAISNAVLQITSIGDIAAGGTSTENLDYYDENNTLIGQTGNAGNCAYDVFTYNMPLSDVLAFSADGKIEVTVTARSGVNTNQCSAQIPGGQSFCSQGTLMYDTATGPNDAGVLSIDSPNVSCEGLGNVVVTIGNKGTNQIVSVTVNWSVGGVPMTPVQFSGLLDTANGTGSTAQVVLGSHLFVGGIPETVLAWTSSPNNVPDIAPANDSASRSYDPLSTISTFPYYEDYESGNGEWVAGGAFSSWALGTPAGSIIQGAASGDTAFATNLTGSYNSNEQSYVASPCFDLSNFNDEAWVSFDINWYTENTWDGAALQASVDGGLTWQTVGAYGDPYNWYVHASIYAAPGGSAEGWSGGSSGVSSGGWVKAAHKLDESVKVLGTRFRVVFGSDGSVQYDGVAFDNFAVVDFAPADLGNDKQSLCGEISTVLDPHVNFNGTIEWSDGDTSSQTITVFQDTVYWVSYTDTVLGITTSDTVLIIESPAPVINFSSADVTISIDESVTLDPQTPYDLNYDWQPSGLAFPWLYLQGADLGLGAHPITLTVTDSVGCTDQDLITVTVLDFTGMNENEEASLGIFPNPVDDVLNIQLKGFEDSQLNLSITDLNGRTVMSESLSHENNRTYKLNLGSLPSGIYMLSVRGETTSLLTKVVVN